jgi:hypothetical protein
MNVLEVKMKKIVAMISLLASLFMLAACSSLASDHTAQLKEQKKSERIIVISSAEPVDVLPAFTTFNWNDGYNRVLSTADSVQENRVKAYIRKQLITYLKTKGYQYQPDPSQADVMIGFLFAMQDTLADKEIIEKFGLPPAQRRNRVARGYKKGTFFLTVLDSQQTKVYWRSMMQGAVGLEKEMENINSSYMHDILEFMMGGFPKAGR